MLPGLKLWDLLQACRRLLLRPSVETRRLIETHRDGLTGAAAPVIFFAGSGAYFFWQAGVASELLKRRDVDRFHLAGASSGALMAALTACGVDLEHAKSSALDMSARHGLEQRRWGLAGIWGPLIRQWLHDLLPHDAADRCNGRVRILVTSPRPWPLLEHRWVAHFSDKHDLVECCMASVHLPFFMDTRLCAHHRGRRHVDVAWFISKSEMGVSPGALVVDPSEDEGLRRTGLTDFLRLDTGTQAASLMEKGKAYAKQLEKQGWGWRREHYADGGEGSQGVRRRRRRTRPSGEEEEEEEGPGGMGMVQ